MCYILALRLISSLSRPLPRTDLAATFAVAGSIREHVLDCAKHSFGLSNMHNHGTRSRSSGILGWFGPGGRLGPLKDEKRRGNFKQTGHDKGELSSRPR